MRKAELVALVAERTGHNKVDILVTVEAMFAEMKAAILRNEEITCRGFGTFSLQLRAAKRGRNIKANQEIQIPPHYKVKFKPAVDFRKEVKAMEVTDEPVTE